MQRNGSRTRRRDTEPPRRVLGRAAAVVVLMAAGIYLAVTLYSGVPLRDYRYVDAKVPDAGSLIGHDPVRIRGLRVGQVVSVRAAGDGQTMLRLQLAPRTPLPADTKIVIRANGLLGARYVELKPGSAREELAAGAVLRGNAASLTFGVTEALDVFDGPTRRRLGTLIGEGANGVQGQGQNLNDMLRVGGSVVTPSADLFRYLRRFPTANAQMLPSVAAGMRPLDANRVALGQLFGATADGLAPIPDRREATQATLEAAPGALAAAELGLVEGRKLVREVRALAIQASGTLPPAPGGLRETSALLTEAKEPLRRTAALLSAARPAVPDLLRVTGSLRPLLKPSLQLTDGSLPIVNTVAPYGCDIENAGVILRSMTGFGFRTPGGPGGSPGGFRLQATTPVGTETVGLTDPTGGRLTRRESYPPPCKYLSEPYPVLLPRPIAGGSR